MIVAFTLSSSFSGSTLLSLLLNAHPEITTISETDPLGFIAQNPDYLCSCGTAIRRCPFFEEVTRQLNDRGIPFAIDDMDLFLRLHRNASVNRLLVGPIPFVRSAWLENLRDTLVNLVPRYRAKKDRTFRRNNVFMQVLTELTGARVFLDANKDPYRMRFFSNYCDVKAIYLFKNGIAGAYSYVKHSKDPRRDITQASRRWFEEQITIMRSIRQLPASAVVRVPYSGLCREPQAHLSSIYEVLGVADGPWRNPNDVPHHIVGNMMRLERFKEIAESEPWKTEMTTLDVNRYRRVYKFYAPKLAALDPTFVKHIWY